MNFFNKIKTIFYPETKPDLRSQIVTSSIGVDLSIPDPKIIDDEFHKFIENIMTGAKPTDKLTNDIKQFILKEAKVLNSGVMEKDGQVWVNLN